MKILMFGQKRVPSREGGIEVVVEQLASRMVKEGHEVILLNRKRKKYEKISEYKGIKTIDVFTINKKAFDAIVSSYFSTKKAIKLAKKEKIDVIHVHAEGPCLFLNKFGKLGSKKRKKMPKIVVTIHGLDWQRNKWGGLATKILLNGEKKAVKYADEIIVLSKNNKKYFSEKYNRAVNYIPNGVNIPEIKKADLITNKYGLNKDDYVLFLARIVPEKGLHYLVKAWKKVVEQTNTTKKLVIAGGSSHTDSYLEEIKNMVKDDKTIIMTGFVEGQELEELFSNAYLYVLPSDVEGMPMSLLEAMSYGNVCLVSDIPENTEVIDGDCFVTEKGNVDQLRHQIKKILRLNLQTHENMIIPYDWDSVTKKTLDLYKK